MRESSWSMKGSIKAGLTLATTMVMYFVAKTGGASAESTARSSVEINLDEAMNFSEPLPLWQPWSKQAESISSMMPVNSQFPALVQLADLNGHTGFKINGEFFDNSYYYSGNSVSGAGDYNGDGYDDFLIQAVGWAYSPNYNYIIFGGPSLGLGGVLNLTDLNGKNGFQFQFGGEGGRSLSGTGDINKDGYDDILIGDQNWFGNQLAAACSYLVFGAASDFKNPFDLSDVSSDSFSFVAETLGYFAVGWAGDINGDGYADMCLGNQVAGRGYVVFGGIGVGSSGINLDNLNGKDGFILNGESGGNTGWSVNGAGDINVDGYADLIIGAYSASPDGKTNAGRSYVVFGGPTINNTTGLITLMDLDGNNGFKIDGERAGDQSGCSVNAAGDVNGDGYDDVLIGASTSTGEQSYVVFGKPGIGQGGVLNLTSLDGSNGFKLLGAGTSVSSAQDFNQDGYADILLGSFGSQKYLVFGSVTLGAGGVLDLTTLNGTDGINLNAEAGTYQSSDSVSGIGDVNGDGYPDIIVGAAAYGGLFGPGRSYVVFGDRPSTRFNTNRLVIHQNETVLISNAYLNATDEDYPSEELWFTISDLQHGKFIDISAPGQAVTRFNQSRVELLQIQFQQDGSAYTPNYTVQADHNRLSYATLLTNITFYRQPQVKINALLINQGQSMIFTTSQLNVIDDYPSEQVIIDVVNIKYGQFQLMPQNTSIVQFTQQQLIENKIIFVQDGTSSSPAYQVIISDPYFKLAPLDATVTFYHQPVWVNNNLVINQGQSIVFEESQVTIIDDYPSDQVVFNIIDLQYGQFQLAPSNNPILKFTQKQLNDGAVLFVQDGTVNIPIYKIVISDPYFTLLPLAANVTFYRQPVEVKNELVINQGQNVSFGLSQLSFNDDYPSDQVIIQIMNLKQGKFQLISSNTPVSQFTQRQLEEGDIAFIQDNTPNSPSYQIVISDPYFKLTPWDAQVTFYRQPTWTSNTLLINQNQSVPFTSQLSFNDDYPRDQVVVEIVNLQHGQFRLMPQNTSVSQFTQQQLIDNKIIFVQDGTSNPPAYQVIISDPYFKLAPLGAQVTFYRQPAWINNKISINQGQSLLITSDMLSVSDDYPQDLVLFTTNNIQNAHFELTSGVTVTQFSAAQISGSQVKLTHDGSSTPPAYQMISQDPYFSLAASQAVVYFYRSPVWVANQLTLTPGAMVLITPTQMDLTDDYSDDQIIFTASNLVGGQFESVDSSHTRLDQWTQQQIRSNQVQFHHNGADMAPNYLITASDPYFSLLPSAPVITYPPQIVNNQLALLQGRASTLTASNLQATDVSPGITPQNLTFLISNVKYGQFTQVTNPSIAILSFTQAQINNGSIQFVQDGSRNVPAYLTLVSDGRFNSSQQAGKVSLNTEPQLVNNRLDIKQGTSVVLTIANLKAVDDTTPDANLIFTLTGIQHGYFASVTQPDQSLSSFLQARIINAEIEFIHDGSSSSPAYAVMVTDGDGLSCPSQNAQISFTPSGGDALRIVNNQLQISQGRSAILSEENLSAVYENNSTTELTFTVSNVQHGQFSWVQSPTGKITQFSQQQINNLEVQFTQDGSRITPGYDVLVSGNGMSTLPQAAKVFLNTAPLLLNNRLTISPGQTVVLSSTNLLATDDTTADDQLQISILNQSHGYFMTLETNHSISGFTQEDVDKLKVAFQHDGSLQEPGYSVIVTDSNGLSTDPQNAQITFDLPSNTQTSTSLRNTIIGAIVSGVASLGFLGLKIFINRRADQYFEKAAESEGVGGEQVEFHKNVIRPIAKCILEYVKITGFIGYVSNRTMQDAFVAIIVLIDALSQKGVEVDLRKLTATQRARFLHTVARETRIKLVPEVSICSCTRLVRFFTPEVTPQQLETEAENIAEAVKAKLGSYQPPLSDQDGKSIPSALPLSRSRLPLNIGRLDRKPATTSRCLLC
ncbi:MAG: FG-GAP repeat protein [Proteobacteria bacterium]|nr:FG-GAP repeat protein [Pseudomonadota bacterium]